MNSASASEDELVRRINSLYLTVILRYKESIEQGEALYIPDLPRLVEPENKSVVVLADSIKGEFDGYSYERDFERAAKSAYDYIRGHVSTVSLPIQFWQKPDETLDNKIGDAFDKSTLFCSILAALGSASAKVVLVVDGSKDVAVFFSSAREVVFYKFDDENPKALPDVDAVRSLMQKSDDAQVYAFNSISCVSL